MTVKQYTIIPFEVTDDDVTVFPTTVALDLIPHDWSVE